MKKYILISNLWNAIILTILFILGMHFYGEHLNTFVFNLSIIIIILLYFIIKVILNIKYWSYDLDKEKLTYIKGFYSINKTIIPLVKIEQITNITNPLLNKYSLVKINIVTTTNTHTLLPIPKDEADKLINFITAYIKYRAGDEDEK